MKAKGWPLATPASVQEQSKALGEPSWLLEDRLAALQRYEALPLESSQLFLRHTEPLRGLEALGPAAAKPALEGPKAKGVQFEELGTALKRAEALRAPLLDGLAAQQDKASNLARALFRTGAVLLVPKEAHVEEPFTVRHAAGPGATFARTLVVLEPGARATLVEEVAPGTSAPAGRAGPGAQGPGLLGLSTEVVLGEGAELRLLGIETAGPEHLTMATRQARLGEGAKLDMHHAFTGSGLVKGRSEVLLQGRGSRVTQTEVVFGARSQRFDLTSNITHQGPDTVSDALSKAVLKDQARANVKGVITITQEAKGSDSYLGQHAMLLSKQARCIAIPSLEIVNRDIQRAKHAATVAQVDEGQVFYLQTRGLPEQEARKAIVLGFLGPLLDRLGEASAERVRARIEAQWG